MLSGSQKIFKDNCLAGMAVVFVQRELFDMEPWEKPREEFKLHKKLGEGHFGEVWEAFWTKENRKVAIKMLKQGSCKQVLLAFIVNHIYSYSDS